MSNWRGYGNGNKKWASYFYRTATTQYPCCVPTLGDLWGAGRKRLTHGKGNENRNNDQQKLYDSINLAG